MVEYTNATELVAAKEYYRKDGKVDMCTAITELIADGKKSGLEQGIKALIEACRELGLDREAVLSMTAKKFELREGAAEEYLAKYWK